MVINKLLGKHKSGDVTTEFIINGIKENNSKIISNAFAKHYSELGKIFAKKVEDSMTETDTKAVLKHTVIKNNLFLFPTNEIELEQLVNKSQP